MARDGSSKACTQRDRARLQVDPYALPAAPRRAHQRQRMERRRFVVVGEPPGERAHGFRVFDHPLMAVTVAVQHFHSVQVTALALGGRLGQALCAAGGELDERPARGGDVLLGRIVVAAGVTQRLTPVREGKAGVRLLRLAKCFRCVLPFEAVKELHPFDELGLRGRGT